MKPDYNTDFYEWTQNQAAALVAGHVSELDLANLAEEIESLGKRDRRGLRNNIKVLLIHLLKWCYQPQRRQTGHSWESTIIEHRDCIEVLLHDSPSLRRQVPIIITEAYTLARRLASSETGLSMETPKRLHGRRSRYSMRLFGRMRFNCCRAMRLSFPDRHMVLKPRDRCPYNSGFLVILIIRPTCSLVTR